MIISRTPFRMSFVGGGSDLPSYYSKNGGAVVSTAIDKFMYISTHKNFDGRTKLAYSQFEDVSRVAMIKHPIVRNALELFSAEGLEISSMADIPAKGTGLGSSSSYAVGLCHCLASFKGQNLTKGELAELACKIEIEMCKDPVGKQDQYAASFGGLNKILFHLDGSVDVQPIFLSDQFLKDLQRNIMFFYVGAERKTSSVLFAQNERNKIGHNDLYLDEMVSLVEPFCDALRQEDIETLGKLLQINWKLKKNLSPFVTNSFIDEAYENAIKNGALGGKLLGAGNGGFLMFLAEEKNMNKLKNSLKPLRKVPIALEKSGTSIIYNDEAN